MGHVRCHERGEFINHATVDGVQSTFVSSYNIFYKSPEVLPVGGFFSPSRTHRENYAKIVGRLSRPCLIVLIFFIAARTALCDIGSWTPEAIWDIQSTAIAEDYSTDNHLWIAVGTLCDGLQLYNFDRRDSTWQAAPLPSNIPNDAPMLRLFTFPEFPDLLFLRVFPILWRTRDQGANWSESFCEASCDYVQSIIHQPEHGNRLLMGSSSNLRVSYNAGLSWNPLENNLPNGIYTLERANDSQGTLFAGCGVGEPNEEVLFRSTDGGSLWESSATGLPDELLDYVSDIASSHLDSLRCWVATNRGVFTSRNGGYQWCKVETGLPDTLFGTIVEDPVDNHLLAIQTWSRTGFYESWDRENWELTTSALPPITPGSIWISTDVHAGGIVVGGKGGLFHRRHGNLDFAPLMLPASVSFPTLCHPARGTDGTLWVSYWSSYVLRSTDHGSFWFPSSNGMCNYNSGDILCTDPTSDSVAYYKTLYKTIDRGDSWFNIGGFLEYGAQTDAMTINPEHPQHLAVAVSEDRSRVFYSANSGETFYDITGNLPYHSYRDLIILATNPETILLAMCGMSEGGIYATTNNGQSWVHRDGNGTLGNWVFNLDIHPGTGYLFANTGYLWYSPDSGSTWLNCTGNLPSVSEFDFDPRANGDVYVVANYSVYRGDGLSTEWETLLQASDSLRAHDLMVDPGPPLTLCITAGVAGGMYSWTEPDTVHVVPKPEPVKPEKFQLKMNAYPNPFNEECQITMTMGEITTSYISFSGVVYNILGQLVKKLEFRQSTPTNFVAHWRGTDEDSIPLSSGIYLVQVACGNSKTSRKILLIR